MTKSESQSESSSNSSSGWSSKSEEEQEHPIEPKDDAEQVAEHVEEKPVQFTGWLAWLNDGFGPKTQLVSRIVTILLCCSGAFITWLRPALGAPFLIGSIIFTVLWWYFIHEYNVAEQEKQCHSGDEGQESVTTAPVESGADTVGAAAPPESKTAAQD